MGYGTPKRGLWGSGTPKCGWGTPKCGLGDPQKWVMGQWVPQMWVMGLWYLQMWGYEGVGPPDVGWGTPKSGLWGNGTPKCGVGDPQMWAGGPQSGGCGALRPPLTAALQMGMKTTWRGTPKVSPGGAAAVG